MHIHKLRTITQEGDTKTKRMTPFFSSAFRALTVYKTHFCIWKFSNSFSWGLYFGSFCSAKYLSFGGESCGIRILSCSIQETYALRKIKKAGFTFSIELRINSKFFKVISGSIILHVSCSMEKKTCFIQFFLKNRTLSFSGVFLAYPVSLLPECLWPLNLIGW